jgi:hypothetical protein
MSSAAAGGVQTAAPTLDLLDVVSLAETETHFENAEVVNAEHAKKPADGRRQALAEVIPVDVHPAASARAHPSRDRAQVQIEPVTVSHGALRLQAGATAYSVG